MYWLSDVAKAVVNAIHRFHCYFFDDEEYGLAEYAWDYGPLAAFIVILAISWFIIR